MIYLNNASTTKPSTNVLEDFIWCAENYWHNPSDISEDGMDAKKVIKTSQKRIADSINAKPDEIIFTSGGSEANNWAIKGYVDKNNVDVIITTEIEHPSVYETCMYLRSCGKKVVFVPVDEFGLIKLGYLEKELSVWCDVCNVLVSVMFANNEVGTIQPIKKISEIVHKYGAHLHVDAVQAYMHTYIDVEDLGIDMMSTSFHKFGGFKNCGFLYIKDGIELTPLIHGGHQFDSKRAGTENVPMIYAMGNQVERLNDDLDVYIERTVDIHNYIIQEVYERCGGVIYLNGHPKKRIANNISFTFEGINASNLITLLEMNGVYVSAGSACCAGTPEPSRIIKAMGFSDEEAFSTVRISIDHNTTRDEVDKFVDVLVECIKSLQIFN